MKHIRVNGCGTYGKNVLKRNVGMLHCEHCRQNQPFAVYEIQDRASVFFIPVAVVKKHYGIMCTRCQKGFELSDDQAGKALAGVVRFQNNNEGGLSIIPQ